MKGLKSIIAISLVPLMVLAIESINPKTVCDRFVNSDDQKKCQNKIQKLKLDSYLSGVCQKQFNDEAFWSCMELSEVASFDPKKIDRCTTNDLSDDQRFNCLKQNAKFTTNPQAEFQSTKTQTTPEKKLEMNNRKPANHP